MTTVEFISKFTAELDVKCTRKLITVTLTLHPENKLALDICGKVELNPDNNFSDTTIIDYKKSKYTKLGYRKTNLEIKMDQVFHDISWFNKEKDLQIELEAIIENKDFDEKFPEGSIWIDPTDKQEAMIIFTKEYRNNRFDKELTTIDISEKYYDKIKKKKRLLDIEVLRKMIELDMVNSMEKDFNNKQKKYRDEHPVEFKVIDEAMDDDGYITGEYFEEDYVPKAVKLDAVKRLAKNLLKNLGGMVTNELQDLFNDIFWAETSEFVDGLQSKLRPLFKPDDIDNIDEITFDIIELVKDNCRALQIKDYNPPTLDDAKEVNSKVTDYIFEEEFKTFTIRYFSKTTEAKVMKIECFNQKTGSKCLQFDNNDDSETIEGHWTPKMVEIDLVYLGTAKGAGHCTHAVGYMLKVLLKEAEKLHEYPYRGKVHISSSNPCAAVNCYSHAFMINGFVPDSTEIAEFREKSKKISKNKPALDFTFYDFISESQKKKMEKYKKKLWEKKSKAETREYRRQLRKEYYDKRRITRSMTKSIAKRVKLRRKRLAKRLKKKKEKVDFLPQLKF